MLYLGWVRPYPVHHSLVRHSPAFLVETLERVAPLRPESNTKVYHLLCGRCKDVQFSARRQYWPNADALPGLGTAIPRTPQPRQTLACLPRRDPRKGCSTPARIKHEIFCPKAILAILLPSVVGLTPDSSFVTSHRQLRDDSLCSSSKGEQKLLCDHCRLRGSLEVAGDTFLSSLSCK
ncbi:hypothetical protein PROFUN_08943 [Planoprotostelium fungivorum]|uniref:Uncharacterized protein n=1 Tax=Planoprotostelium fungivorum TaxID=1890364 RepID=A0A2P6NIN4_9EUKA|nr:hypothetical protein PROFUN_08943 [Planoprotostelium fungivorum]